MIYALFYCFIGVNTPCVLVGHSEISGYGPGLEGCNFMKHVYEYGNGSTPEILTRKGLKYVCMSKTAPPQWAPAQ